MRRNLLPKPQLDSVIAKKTFNGGGRKSSGLPVIVFIFTAAAASSVG